MFGYLRAAGLADDTGDTSAKAISKISAAMILMMVRLCQDTKVQELETVKAGGEWWWWWWVDP